METKKRLSEVFDWLDSKFVWLFHLPKPVNWKEFDRKLQEAIKEDERRYIAALREAKLAGIKEVVEFVDETAIMGYKEGELGVKPPTDLVLDLYLWQAFKKSKGIE